MNLCILDGKVINEIDLKFIYNIREKSLGRNHISIAIIYIEIPNKQIINLQAYDEIAEFVYQNMNKGDYIMIEGKIRNGFIEIANINLNIIQ